MDSVDEVSLLEEGEEGEGQSLIDEDEEEEQEQAADAVEQQEPQEITSATGLDNKGNDVASWLISLNLENLVPRFYSQGYDDLELIKALDDKDLDALGIDKPGIRKKLLLYAARLGKMPIVSKPAPMPAKPAQPPTSSQPQQQLAPPPQPSKKSRSPYRCSKCCMFKVQSINKHNSHKCDEKLIGHTWENCPTNNLRAHPEEQDNRRKRKAEERKKKKEETKKQKVEKKVKQPPQREHPLVAVDWDTFRQEELRRMIQANPERYSKDMEGQRLMEAMVIIIARYNELKETVEQVKNRKRKFVNSPPEPIVPMTMQEVLETNNRLTINPLQTVSPAMMQQQHQMQLAQLQQQETLVEQHKLQLQHLQLQQQLQQRQKQHEALQSQEQALQTQQQQLQQQRQQSILQHRQQLLVQQQMMHHHQQAQQAVQQLQQPQQHALLQSVVLPNTIQPSMVSGHTSEEDTPM